MATPQDLRENLNARMEAIGLSLTDLGKLSQVSVPSLSNFLSGRRELRIHEVQLIGNLMTDLENVAKICCPIPVNFSNVEMVKALLPRLLTDEMKPTTDTDAANLSRARIIIVTVGAVQDFMKNFRETKSEVEETPCK